MPSMAGPQLPEPQASVPVVEGSSKVSRKKSWLLTIITLAVIVAVGATYAFFTRDRAGTAVGNTRGRTDIHLLSSLKGVTLVPPTDLSRYLANGSNTPTRMQYATSDGQCRLRMGVVSKDVLPGKDFDAIVNEQIKAQRDKGAKVDGPSKQDPLYLADVSDDSRAYQLSTVSFVSSQKDLYANTYYSAAVLKDDSRVYVVRECESKDAQGNPEKIQAINEDAADVAVVVQR